MGYIKHFIIIIIIIIILQILVGIQVIFIEIYRHQGPPKCFSAFYNTVLFHKDFSPLIRVQSTVPVSDHKCAYGITHMVEYSVNMEAFIRCINSIS